MIFFKPRLARGFSFVFFRGCANRGGRPGDRREPEEDAPVDAMERRGRVAEFRYAVSPRLIRIFRLACGFLVFADVVNSSLSLRVRRKPGEAIHSPARCVLDCRGASCLAMTGVWFRSGLLRRFAPRNDETVLRFAMTGDGGMPLFSAEFAE